MGVVCDSLKIKLLKSCYIGNMFRRQGKKKLRAVLVRVWQWRSQLLLYVLPGSTAVMATTKKIHWSHSILRCNCASERAGFYCMGET